MPEQITVALQPRTMLGKRVRRLRREGIIPANIYGNNRNSRPVQIDAKEAHRLLAAHAGSAILRLHLDGAADVAVIRHVQREPKTDDILHIDFMHIELTEAMHARVPVRLIGEAPAVRIHGGTVLHLLDAVEVECLPGDLPATLDLDIAQLDSLDSVLRARDLQLSPGVRLLTPPDEVLVKVASPRTEEAAAPTPLEETPAATPAAAAQEPTKE